MMKVYANPPTGGGATRKDGAPRRRPNETMGEYIQRAGSNLGATARTRGRLTPGTRIRRRGTRPNPNIFTRRDRIV